MKKDRMDSRLYHGLLAAAFVAGFCTVGFNAVRAPDLLPACPALPVYEQLVENGAGLLETPYFTDAGSFRININTASAAELQSLPGVGEKLADAIVAYRQENGRFRSRKELMEVKGIGEKTYEKLKDHLDL
ncbi:MAG: helix-hairpin-helix domain-containing protein [Provencibacterium sp.]|jgi:competence ComEA-like helix-hairpin-helix protein|nr:helix-hairpin-helix domain-containing protein [Provencibacterium sp.]